MVAAVVWLPFQELVYRPFLWFDHLVARVAFDTRAQRYKIVNISESKTLKSQIFQQINRSKASAQAQLLTDKLKRVQSVAGVENPINTEFVDTTLVNWNFIDEKPNENLNLEIPVLTGNEVETIFMEALEGDPTSKIMKVLVDMQAEIRQLKSSLAAATKK